jgi:hypothetical protein
MAAKRDRADARAHLRSRALRRRRRMCPTWSVAAAVFAVLGAGGALGACSSGSSPRVSATTPTTAAPTTTTSAPEQRLDGTGTAYLMHSGPHGFVLFNGAFTSPLLGRGKFHEDATFGTKPNTNPYWSGKATFTASNGDTLAVKTVGGIQSFDAHNDPHSATRETVIGGTGRFAGGRWIVGHDRHHYRAQAGSAELPADLYVHVQRNHHNQVLNTQHHAWSQAGHLDTRFGDFVV